MIEQSRRFNEIMRGLYDSHRAKTNQSYENIMKDNCSRLDFLNSIFHDYEEGELSPDCRKIFKDNIDFINKFLQGDFKDPLVVPKVLQDDYKKQLIIPNQTEINYMLDLIRVNVEIYRALYKDRNFIIKLPDNSFNMNMSRILSIKEDKVAHLLGLTDSRDSQSEHKNLLKGYFIRTVGEDISKYGDTEATALLNWIISDEGRKEILKLNGLLLDFVEEDRKKHPDSYVNGNLKNEKSKNRFQKDFDQHFASQGLQYPMIRFSKIFMKCINNFSFLNMEHINSCIVDFNSRQEKSSDPDKPPQLEDVDEKDLFLVSVPPELLEKLTEEYINDVTEFEEKVRKYKQGDPKNDQEVEDHLTEMGITEGPERTAFLNLAQTYKFVENNGILSDEKAYRNAKTMIRNYYEDKYDRVIHLIGFDSYNKTDEQGNPIVSELYESMVHNTHCDTSIGISIGKLVDTYYVRGRAFFLDKVETKDGSYLRISNPTEEISYQRDMLSVGYPDPKRLNALEKKMASFLRRFKRFIKLEYYEARNDNLYLDISKIIEPAFLFVDEHLIPEVNRDNVYQIFKQFINNQDFIKKITIKYQREMSNEKGIEYQSLDEFFIEELFVRIVKKLHKEYLKQLPKNEEKMSFNDFYHYVTTGMKKRK